MAEIQAQKLKGIVASMMERQAQETKAAPSGVIGGLWEKATGEIERYNKALEDHVKLDTKRKRLIQKMTDAQERIDELNREIAEGLRDEGDAAAEASKEIHDLTKQMERLQNENRETAESANLSTQSLNEMAKGGSILKNGLTALLAKVGGTATALFGLSNAIMGVDERFALAAKSVGALGADALAPTADKTASYADSLIAVGKHTWAWHNAITDATWSLAKFGIGSEETKNMIVSLSDGLRLTTNNQEDLIKQTSQMTQDIGFMSKLLRVNTDELATATVDASKRFGRSTTTMANDLAGLYDSIQTIKSGSKDTVMSFSDMTRATLEAQSSFQGYNFNLKTTANLLGNVVAKAQEQGATYEMSMKAAQGLANVITGGKAPDWAKYLAGKDMLTQMRSVVRDAEKEGANIQERLAAAFSIDADSPAGKKQLEGLENLAKNYKKYGNLSSAKMAEELLRGTEKSNEAMFEMMKKQADRPEGRELLMRVWGLDEAAATAATLALHSAESVKDFTRIQEDAKAATAGRKPPSVNDLREQTGAFAAAIGQAGAGIKGNLENILNALKQNPLVSGALGVGGAAMTGGVSVLQAGLGEAVGKHLADSRVGTKLASVAGGAINRVAGVAGKVLKAPLRLPGMAARGVGAAARAAPSMMGGVLSGGAAAADVVTSMRSGGMVWTEAAKKQGKAMQALTKVSSKVSGAFGAVKGGLAKMNSSLMSVASGAGSKAGLVGLAAVVGVAVGSVIRLIPGVDGFTQGLIDSAAKLFGFKGALSDAEVQQEALNNKSAGIAKAIKQVTEGITTDYEKDSLKHMIAVRQLQGLRDEDLSGFAKKISDNEKITEKEAMVRLKTLRAEKVDNAKFLAARKETMKDVAPEKQKAAERKKSVKSRLEVARASIEAAAPVVTQLTPDQKQAVTAQVAMELGPEMQTMAQPMFQKLEEAFTTHWTTSTDLARSFWQQQMPAMAIDSWNRVGAAFEQRLGVPTSLPLPGGRAGGGAAPGTPAGAAGAGTRMGGAVVRPDGSISLNVMIPRDALSQSESQAAGMSE